MKGVEGRLRGQGGGGPSGASCCSNINIPAPRIKGSLAFPACSQQGRKKSNIIKNKQQFGMI